MIAIKNIFTNSILREKHSLVKRVVDFLAFFHFISTVDEVLEVENLFPFRVRQELGFDEACSTFQVVPSTFSSKTSVLHAVRQGNGSVASHKTMAEVVAESFRRISC